MSVANFIPQIWSARLLANLDKKLVFGNFFNRDYEGEISQFGDSVVINQMGDITIKDYTGADIDTPEDVTSETQTLQIDKAKYFNFRVKDVDQAQANVELVDRAMARASYAIADAIDVDLAGVLVTQKGSNLGTIASPITITVSNAYDKLVDLGVKLDEENVERVGRRIALPAWYLGLLSKDPRFTTSFNILENGLVEGASVAGFEIYMSNNVVKDTVDPTIFRISACTTRGGSYAGQVTETEAYRPEKNFADAVKGLYVYGRKVVEPKAVVEFVVKQGA